MIPILNSQKMMLSYPWLHFMTAATMIEEEVLRELHWWNSGISFTRWRRGMQEQDRHGVLKAETVELLVRE